MIRFVKRTTIFIHGYLIQCFCDFAPLNSKYSSARRYHAYTHSQRLTFNTRKTTTMMTIKWLRRRSQTHATTTTTLLQYMKNIHTLSTLLKRISLALSPASQLYLAYSCAMCSLHRLYHGPPDSSAFSTSLLLLHYNNITLFFFSFFIVIILGCTFRT